MQTKNMFRHLLFGIFSIAAFQCGNLVAGGFPGMPAYGQGPSMEDIKAMEAEIDNFVRSLPPEQQKQFYKDVEELTGIMEKMSPDELNEFVGSVFTDAGLIEPVPAPTQKPEVKTEPARKEEAKPAVVVTTAPSGPTEKAIAMITKIINRTEEFMRKAQIIPELQSKMDKWVVQKKLLDVTAKLDWEAVESQIDELNILLYALKEQDPITKQYKHIGNLVKDEVLYNNLATLQVTLEAYVPLVHVPDFGLETVSKESRAAIREVLSQYLECFYLLNVPNTIKKVISLYAPRAKELSEEEKRFSDQAQKDAEKTRRQLPAEKSTGTKSSYVPSYDSSYDYGSHDYDYTPSYNSSYTPSQGPSSASSDQPVVASISTLKAPGSSGGSSGKSGASKKEGGKDSRGEEDFADFNESGTSTTKGGKPGTQGGKSAKQTELELARASYKIMDAVEAATNPLKGFEGDIFKKFNEHFFDGNDFSNDFVEKKLTSLVSAIATANTKLKAATSDIKKFKTDLKSLATDIQEPYKKDLASSLKDAVKFYEALHRDITAIKDASSLGTSAAHMKAGKNYIYFAHGTLADSNPIKAKVPNVSVTMDQLDKTIEAFLKEANAK